VHTAVVAVSVVLHKQTWQHDFEPACQVSKRATPSVAQGDDSPSSFLLETGVATQVGSHVCSKAHTPHRSV